MASCSCPFSLPKYSLESLATGEGCHHCNLHSPQLLLEKPSVTWRPQESAPLMNAQEGMQGTVSLLACPKGEAAACPEQQHKDGERGRKQRQLHPSQHCRALCCKFTPATASASDHGQLPSEAWTPSAAKEQDQSKLLHSSIN